MRWCLTRLNVRLIALPITLLFAICSRTSAQSTASIKGQVFDQHRAAIPGATVTARNPAIGFERIVTSDSGGRYQLAALPVGDYTLAITATRFKQQIIERLKLEVGRI